MQIITIIRKSLVWLPIRLQEKSSIPQTINSSDCSSTKVHGKPLPSNVIIHECDLYGDKNPWEIWQQFGDGSHSYGGGKDLYFFTTLKKKSPSRSSRSRRSVRTIGCGSWEGEDTGKIIVASGTNQLLGIKKRYRFEKSGTDHDGGWILHEYSLGPSMLSNPHAINWVLCRFRKNLKNESVIRQRKTIVLALASATAESVSIVGTVHIMRNNVRLGEDIFLRGPRNYLESGVNRTRVVETTTKSKSEYKEEYVNVTMFGPESFSMELREFEGCLIQEEDIPLLPNPFYLDLLLEMIDIKYIKSSSK
ncbi:NAC domain [Sesbania bispinosa]|nr:NAC domain [Sesbania bispinosa]